MLKDLFAICSAEKNIDEMHLTPFLGTVQLRPSFKYLDKIDEKHKQATKKVSDEENKEQIAKQKAESEQKAKALQVWLYHPHEHVAFTFVSSLKVDQFTKRC